MTEKTSSKTPNALWSILTMKCPRCRRGQMFTRQSAYRNLSLKNIFEMPEVCEECGQKFDLEPGFWYGNRLCELCDYRCYFGSYFRSLVGINRHICK